MSEIPAKSDNRYALLGAVIVAIITFFVFYPALNNGFVNWDDPYYVYRNPNIRSLDLVWAFTAEVSSNWHPLTLISHTLDYAIFGLNPRGHHLTSNLLHSLNTFFVALLFYYLTLVGMKKEAALGGPDGSNETNSTRQKTLFALAASLITALCFGIHPLRVESVVWISERKDLLYALFYILSTLAYIKYATMAEKNMAANKKFYALSLFAFMLSLLSKPMAISLPLVLIIMDTYPLRRASLAEMLGKKKKILLEKAPFFLLSIISAILTIRAQAGSGAMSTLENAPVITRLLVSCRAYIFYIYKTIVPIKLAPIYPYPGSANPMTGELIGGVIILISLSLILLWYLREKKLFGALWLYYLITLLPAIGIVHVGRQSAADRYTYLPGLALLFFFGLFTARLITGKKPWLRSITIIIVTIISILLGAKTVKQEAIWRDSITLWSYEIGLYGELSPAVAFRNRGLALQERGEFGAALGDFDKAIKIDPMHEGAYGNRGLSYQNMGNFPAALRDYDRAIEIDPLDKTAINNRGTALGTLKRYNEAKRDFERVIEIDPNHISAHNNLGKLYKIQDNRELSIIYHKKAAELGSEWARDYLKREGIE